MTQSQSTRSELKKIASCHCEALFAEVPLFGSAFRRDPGRRTISISLPCLCEIARLPHGKPRGGQASLRPFGASLAMTLRVFEIGSN
jgi:hypothetical protein